MMPGLQRLDERHIGCYYDDLLHSELTKFHVRYHLMPPSHCHLGDMAVILGIIFKLIIHNSSWTLAVSHVDASELH